LKALVRVVVVAEMKVELDDVDSAKDEIDDALTDARINAGLEAVGLSLRLASKRDLEDMAEAGALLPNPGVYIVDTRKARK
jgi:hypothetical protein